MGKGGGKNEILSLFLFLRSNRISKCPALLNSIYKSSTIIILKFSKAVLKNEASVKGKYVYLYRKKIKAFKKITKAQAGGKCENVPEVKDKNSRLLRR